MLEVLSSAMGDDRHQTSKWQHWTCNGCL